MICIGQVDAGHDDFDNVGLGKDDAGYDCFDNG